MADQDKRRPSQPAGKKPPPKPPSPERKPVMNESAKTEGKGSSDDIFEVSRIRKLVELMKEHDLSEIDLRESRQRIRICRGPKEGPRVAYGPPPPPAPAAGSAAAAKPAAAVDGANITIIKSPMVGTFYVRANPKAEPYVKVGDRVDTTTVICIIEAMKVFNEIPAEVRGKIVAVLCEDGEAVEFDKPLFKVDTSG
jgi:acetyl-CoA carboxylase biotin carboxyl carrier protein